MRGTQPSCFSATRDDGIIPAYAGNTEYERSLCPMCGDHPRVCGEHIRFMSWRSTRPGSSPRMRGTQSCPQSAISTRGIIPAYAGNTRRTRYWQMHGRDHPRVCGEHTGIKVGGMMGEGSSPRMRGTRFRVGNTWRVVGIIPAYAGNTEQETDGCSVF